MKQDTINFLYETENAIGDSGHHSEDVAFVGSRTGYVVLSYVWRWFRDRLDFDYPRDTTIPSGRRVPWDMIIRFNDGTYLYRELDPATNIAEWKYAPAAMLLTSRFNLMEWDVFGGEDPVMSLDNIATSELLESIESLKKPPKEIISREHCVKVLNYIADGIDPEEEDDGTREPEGYESL